MTPDTQQGDLLIARAKVARNEGRLDDAARDQGEAVSLLRAAGSDRLAHALRHHADILQQAGRHAEADPLYAETLALYEAASAAPLDVANARRSVALHREHMGDLEGSLAMWRDVRSRYAALESVFGETYGLPNNPGVEECDRHIGALTRAGPAG